VIGVPPPIFVSARSAAQRRRAGAPAAIAIITITIVTVSASISAELPTIGAAAYCLAIGAGPMLRAARA